MESENERHKHCSARAGDSTEHGKHRKNLCRHRSRASHNKAAGLDYWHLLDITYYENLDDFFEKNPGCDFYLFSTKAPRCYTDVEYKTPVFLFFGKETKGLPEDFLRANIERCVRIPMRENLRSLNLSNSAAIGVYEVLRQQGFRGQQSESSYLD